MAEYLDGWNAWRSGIGETENPFDEKSRPDAHKAWAQGWREAAETELGGGI